MRVCKCQMHLRGDMRTPQHNDSIIFCCVNIYTASSFPRFFLRSKYQFLAYAGKAPRTGLYKHIWGVWERPTLGETKQQPKYPPPIHYLLRYSEHIHYNSFRAICQAPELFFFGIISSAKAYIIVTASELWLRSLCTLLRSLPLWWYSLTA